MYAPTRLIASALVQERPTQQARAAGPERSSRHPHGLRASARRCLRRSPAQPAGPQACARGPDRLSHRLPGTTSTSSPTTKRSSAATAASTQTRHHGLTSARRTPCDPGATSRRAAARSSTACSRECHANRGMRLDWATPEGFQNAGSVGPRWRCAGECAGLEVHARAREYQIALGFATH